MSKITCDICGTKYPDTEKECPICGYSNSGVRNDSGEDEIFLGDIFNENMSGDQGELDSEPVSKSPVAPAAEEEKYEIDFDDDETDDDYDDEDDEDDDDEDDEDDDDEEGKSGIFLSILLGIVILALLCVSGYIFVQYFLPNMMAAKDAVPTTEPVVQTDAPETDAPTVPCAELVMTEQIIELNDIGQMYLLNVAAEPADTTDVLNFESSDEDVVVVNGEGRITAIGEGTAVVTITCGEQRLDIAVSVVVPTEEPTEAPTEEPTEEATEEPTEAPTEAPTEPLKDVKLEINGATDVTFNAKGLTFTFKLKNGLKNNEVTWTSENEKVCTVDENGFLTCTGTGKTNVIVRYGDQEVVIIVRVK